MCGVYMFENKINHHKYIGASKHIEKRYKEHLRDMENNTQKQKTLYKAFKKYGLDNFEFSIIEECLPGDRFKREKYWIDYYNTYEDGYNETRGGEGLDGAPKAKGDNHPNSVISEATAKKIISELATTRLPFSEIAKKYSCSVDIVKDINGGKTHTYLHNYGTNIREKNSIKRNSSFEKLSIEEVYQIIHLLGTTSLNYTQIGKMFSVSQQTISRINNCQTWKELHSYKKNIREEMMKSNEI